MGGRARKREAGKGAGERWNEETIEQEVEKARKQVGKRGKEEASNKRRKKTRKE